MPARSPDRRWMLRAMGLGAAGLAVAGSTSALSACSGGEGESAPGPSSAPSPRPRRAAASVEAHDPDVPYWLQGGFAPVEVETTATELEVTGSLPTALSGLYVRNGSNPVRRDSAHWFVGDGMVHGVRLERGRALWYRNRHVRTLPKLRGVDLPAMGLPGGAANQSNVSLVHHAGRLLSLGEVGHPYELLPADLSTVGVHDFDGRLTTAMTAHPKRDPATGQLHSFGYGFVEPLLTYHVIDSDGRLIASQPIDIPASTMVHDFAITETDVVFWLCPVLFGPPEQVPGFPFRWAPGDGASRVGIMPLGGPTSAMRWVDIDPCMVFHGANAHRDGDEVVIRVHRLGSAFGPDGDLPSSHLTEWRVGTAGNALTWREERLTDVDSDLPMIDRRWTGRRERHSWSTTIDLDGPWGFELAGIAHRDHTSGRERRWEPGPLERAGEALFVAEGDGEGEGWLLTYTYDRTTDTSTLAVLDATDVAAGPVARVHLPVRVPYGFHGCWLPG